MNNSKFESEDESKQNNENSTSEIKRVLSRFKSEKGEILPGGLLDLPINITIDKLQAICNALLQNEEPVPFAFYINDTEITDSLQSNINENINISEDVLEIIYQPQAIFKVKSVTRCSGSLEGTLHVIQTQFNPFKPDSSSKTMSS